jgi:hypothetical protein
MSFEVNEKIRHEPPTEERDSKKKKTKDHVKKEKIEKAPLSKVGQYEIT